MRTGGILESMMPGTKEHSDQERGSGGRILDAMVPATDNTPDLPGALKKIAGSGGPKSGTGTKNDGGKTARNSKFEKFPATENYLGPRSKDAEDAGARVSAFDSQGSVGHQFSVCEVAPPDTLI